MKLPSDVVAAPPPAGRGACLECTVGKNSGGHYNDCMHMAYASVYICDVLVSWNFRHLVKARTMDGVRVVNENNRYGEIVIVSPAILLDKGGRV
jgi:phage terminase large subunit-like protein